MKKENSNVMLRFWAGINEKTLVDADKKKKKLRRDSGLKDDEDVVLDLLS